MKRAAVALLVGGLLVPAATAAPAAAKTKRVCKTVRIHGKRKRRCHLVAVRQVRVPISATVLDGSSATLDFGNGTVRTVGLRGRLTGHVPGRIRLGRAITAILDGGSLAVAPTDFFSDSCASPVWARSNPATSIRLDPAKVNRATLNPDGSITSDASVIIRAVLDSRPQGACDSPLATAGYTDTPVTVHLHGQVGTGGLTSLLLTADPYPLMLKACFTPGAPAAPCGGAPVSYPATAAVSLRVMLAL